MPTHRAYADRAATKEKRMSAGPTPAGWYPYPDGTTRYWDGQGWTTDAQPIPRDDLAARRSGAALATVLAVVGVVLNAQSVSLARGSGIVWTGVALAVGAAVVAIAVPPVRTWVKITCAVVAMLTVANAVYVEKQLSNQRHQIEQIIGD
jgi:uncharacterized protein DUF2510